MLGKMGQSFVGEQPNQVVFLLNVSLSFRFYNVAIFPFEASTTHKILLQAPVSIISNSECSSKYQFNIADNSLCASAGSQEGITCSVSFVSVLHNSQ